MSMAPTFDTAQNEKTGNDTVKMSMTPTSDTAQTEKIGNDSGKISMTPAFVTTQNEMSNTSLSKLQGPNRNYAAKHRKYETSEHMSLRAGLSTCEKAFGTDPSVRPVHVSLSVGLNAG